MRDTYDVVVIGGGHNGLSTAALLSKAGKKVLVVEKRGVLGGIGAEEEFHPEYRTAGLVHDTSNFRSKLIGSLNLEQYGLKLTGQRSAVGIMGNGSGVVLSGDRKECARQIAQFSESDGQAYLNYHLFLDKIRPFLANLTDNIPPNLAELRPGDFWKLLRSGVGLRTLGRSTMMELLKVAPMSLADFLDERFETDLVKAGLAGPAISGTFTGPRSPYSTLNLLLWECMANQEIVGGPAALIAALEQAARNAGVEIVTGKKIERILVNPVGKVSGVQIEDGLKISSEMVAASCTPQTAILDLLDPRQVDYPLEQEILHYRARGTTAKVNLGLKELPRFGLTSKEPLSFFRTGNSLDDMERAFDAVKYRSCSLTPLLDIHIPTINNPALAPSGCHVVSILVHYAPFEPDGGWTDDRSHELGERVISVLEKHSPGIRSFIEGKEILTPLDLEERYGLTGGHIFHGEHAIDQLISRPVPSCSSYSTPVEGLYLCGSGSHPGGGITGAPGALAAKVMLGKKSRS